jgi:hypothetical protein
MAEGMKALSKTIELLTDVTEVNKEAIKLLKDHMWFRVRWDHDDYTTYCICCKAEARYNAKLREHYGHDKEWLTSANQVIYSQGVAETPLAMTQRGSQANNARRV